MPPKKSSATSATRKKHARKAVGGPAEQLDASAGLSSTSKSKDAKEIKEIKERVYRRVWRIPYGAKVCLIFETRGGISR